MIPWKTTQKQDLVPQNSGYPILRTFSSPPWNIMSQPVGTILLQKLNVILDTPTNDVNTNYNNLFTIWQSYFMDNLSKITTIGSGAFSFGDARPEWSKILFQASLA